jgi:small multidrug resistance pump
MTPWLLLALAIALEITGTTALKLSEGLANLRWAAVVLVSYGGAFTAMSFALKSLPVGLTYAIWSGVGTVGAAIIGRVVFGEPFGVPHLLGTALILGGVVVLNLAARAA